MLPQAKCTMKENLSSLDIYLMCALNLIIPPRVLLLIVTSRQMTSRYHISSIPASVCPIVFVHHRLSPTLKSDEDPQHIDLTGKLHPLSLHVVHDDDETSSGQRWGRSGNTSSAG